MITIRLKTLLSGYIGAIWSSAVYVLFGNVTDELKTLSLLILLDLICGVMTAAVFHTSSKTSTGRLSSTAMTKGICKKIGIFIFVVIGHIIDSTLHITYIMYAVEICFIIEEIISITEKLGLMGLNLPAPIQNGLDILNKKVNDIMKGE
nr:MAG TPA: holin [Caudoviricetes sp.]